MSQQIFQIEQNIPIPPKKKTGAPSGIVKRTLEQLEVGQNFWIPVYSEYKVQAIHTQARRLGIKVATRKTVKHDRVGVRVWRIKDETGESA